MAPRFRSLIVISCLVGGCAAPTTLRSYDLPSSSIESAATVASRQAGSFVPPPGQQQPVLVVPNRDLVWRPGQALMQGYFGVSYFDKVSVDGNGPGHVDGDEGDLDQMPVFGGGGQWKLSGEKVDFGLEGMFDFSWRANAEAFVVGGGGAAIAVDVDLWIWELYGGPFISTFIGDKMRLYAAAGPVLQWASYDQTGGLSSDHGSGFGTGLYARTGIEFVLPSRTMVGLGARWSDTRTDLSGGAGDLEIDGLQIVLTVTRGF
jgi:hypothetical protein